jgi:hypothetical protein
VLGVVDHQQGPLAGEVLLERGGQRLGRGCLDRTADGRHDRRLVVDVGEGDDPDAVVEVVRERPRRLQGQGGLADAAGTDEGDQPALAKEHVELLELALPADDARQAAGHRRPGAPGALRRRRGREHLVLHLGVPRGRVESHLRGVLAVAAGLGRGLRLAPGRVQGAQQADPRRLPEGILGGQLLERRSRLLAPVRGEQQLGATQPCLGVQLDEPSHLAGEVLVVRELAVGAPPPQREHPVDLVDGGGGVHVAFEPVHVEALQRHGQRVPGSLRDDHVVAERVPQP